MKRFKTVLCALLALVMAWGLCACGGDTGGGGQSGGNGGSGGGDEAQKRVTITVWATPLTDDPALDGLIEELVLPAFAEKRPDVKVEVEMLTWEGVTEKLQSALRVGATPDVFLDGTARTAALPALGVLEPVDDVIGAYDDWYGTVMDIGVVDGKHYLVPASTIAASRLDVNVTLAKELGVYDRLPADKTSWDIHDFYEFIKAAAEAGADRDVFGTFLYAGSATSDDILYSLMLSNGGEIIDFDTMTCTANSPECVEVVEVLGDIVKNGYAMPGAATALGGDVNTPFLNRQLVLALNMAASAAMNSMSAMVEEGYMETIDECANYGVPHPAGRDMVCTSWGANCFAVFTNDGDVQRIQAAKDFVETFVGSREMASAIWQAAPTYAPARNCGITYHNENLLIQAAVSEHADWSAQYANSSFGMLESFWPEVRSCFYPELQAVYTGEKTAQQAMDSFAENVNTILAAVK